MKFLAYYTIGYQESYITILKLSIKSLRKYNPDIDIRILCDIQFKDEIMRMFPDVQIYERPNSSTPQLASMQKLSIFNEDLSDYDTVLFIDSDILIGIPLTELLSQVINEEKLYAFAEKEDQSAHKYIFWSFEDYSNDQLHFFQENNIRVINAGLFAFKPTNIMKMHFDNINAMICNHNGKFFYEQSFMNVYFNTRNLVDYSLWTNKNYSMDVTLSTPPNMILHFSGDPGIAMSKIYRMNSYIKHTNFFSNE
jgi:alpha-N-acetylglucosamine transferase